MTTNNWYGVRCIFRWGETAAYEERIAIWRALSIDVAIEKAEKDAHSYAQENQLEYLNIAQAYLIGSENIDEATEVFSLIRDSDLEPGRYLSWFYDTGSEHQAR